MSDLSRLNKEVSKVLDEYDSKSSDRGLVIDQINYLQQALSILSANESPANSLNEVVAKILNELDSEKEQEIIDFLNNLKSQKHSNAEDRYNSVVHSISEVEKLWRQINGDNEDFISQLSQGRKGANKDKAKLIESLSKESDGSKVDLKKIKDNIDIIKKSLVTYNMGKISLKEIHELLKDLNSHEQTIQTASSDIENIEQEIEERKRLWNEYLTKTEVMDRLVRELLSLTPLLREKYERLVKTHNF